MRPHGDLEIAVLRADLPAVAAALTGCSVHPIGRPDEDFQHWVLDRAAGVWRLDVMTEPGDDDWWAFRPEPSIRRPRAEAVACTADGVPYLRPECALLFKARTRTAKDEVDLAACLPLLDADAGAWLLGALRTLDDRHPWIDRVGRGA